MKPLFKSLSIVAAHYGEKMGVNVVFGNDPHTAETDGDTITVPSIPEDYDVNALWGFLVHESAHVKLTDFDFINSQVSHSDFFMSLANILEDARIENNFLSRYPGIRNDLDTAVNYAVEQRMLDAPTEDSAPAEVLLSYCLIALRSLFLGQPCGELLPQNREAMLNTFPPGVLTRLEVLLRQVSTLNSTQDVYGLCGDIIKMLDDEAKEPEEPNEKGDSSGAEENSGSCTNPGSDSSQDSTDGAPGDDQSKRAAIQSALNASSEDVPRDVFEAMRDQMKADAKEAIEQGKDVCTSIPSSASADVRHGDGYSLTSNAKANTSRLRAQMMGLIQSHDLGTNSVRRQGRRLNSSKLHRVLAGDMNVFKGASQEQRPNTAIHFLGDLSGSMGTINADVAKEAVLSLCMALDAVDGVSIEASYFLGSERQPVYTALHHGQRVAQRQQAFDVLSDGSTPMAEAIWYAAFSLSKRPEVRKMIFVFTDGKPNNPGATIDIIGRCKDQGIELFGIGIGREGRCIKDFFSQSTVINSVGDLKSTLFGLVRGQLTHNRGAA